MKSRQYMARLYREWLRQTTILISVKFSYIFLFPLPLRGHQNSGAPHQLTLNDAPFTISEGSQFILTVIRRILDRPDLYVIPILFVHFNVYPVSRLVAHQCFAERRLDTDQSADRISAHGRHQTVRLCLIVLLQPFELSYIIILSALQSSLPGMPPIKLSQPNPARQISFRSCGFCASHPGNNALP